jgi:hypothetical protein
MNHDRNETEKANKATEFSFALRDHGSRREETRIQRDEIRIQKRIKETTFEEKLTKHIKYFPASFSD